MSIRSILLRLPLISSLYVPSSYGDSTGTGYIITGAPGSGKTMLARGLEIGGEDVVHEAARDVFEYQMVALGEPEPWLLPDAQEHVTRLQLAREARAPRDSRFIMDRSVIDGAGYTMLRTFSATEAAKQLIACANVQRYNRKVFLTESTGHISGPGERIAVIEDSRRIERALRVVYTKLGFQVVDVPWMPVQERCAFVKRQMDQPSEPLDWEDVRIALRRQEYSNWSCDDALVAVEPRPEDI